MSKKKKTKFVDDGHTVYDMSGLTNSKPKEDSDSLGLNRKERFAIVRAGLSVYLPKLVIIIIGFSLAFLLIYFWLR